MKYDMKSQRFHKHHNDLKEATSKLTANMSLAAKCHKLGSATAGMPMARNTGDNANREGNGTFGAVDEMEGAGQHTMSWI